MFIFAHNTTSSTLSVLAHIRICLSWAVLLLLRYLKNRLTGSVSFPPERPIKCSEKPPSSTTGKVWSSKSSFKRHLKPYWNNDFKQLHFNMLSYCKIWIINGKPRSLSHENYADLKTAKRIFIKTYRKCEALLLVFFQQKTQMKNKSSLPWIRNKVSRKCCTGPIGKVHLCADYFAELYTDALECDKEHKQHV